MQNSFRLLAPVSLLLGALAVPREASALINRPYPLNTAIQDSDQIYVARVVEFDSERPSMVLKWERDLKGKDADDRLAVNLNGDKEGHTPQMLKRLQVGLPIVCFVTENQGTHLALCYTNGTWFQLLGRREGDRTRWSFTHCEIYLRRTFKGSTAELEQLLVDVLAGKVKPPPVNSKESPGFGPEAADREK